MTAGKDRHFLNPIINQKKIKVMKKNPDELKHYHGPDEEEDDEEDEELDADD